MIDFPRNFLRFSVLVLLQVLLLNKIGLQWWSNVSGHPFFLPYIYPLFILLLPFETPVWLLMILGLVLGLTVDAFMTSPGMHACATVLIAYLRTNVLTALLPKNIADYPNQSPNVRLMGWLPFLTYAAFLFFVHHLVYFFVERWSFRNVGQLLITILASTVTSLLMVVAYLLLFTRQPGRAETR